MYLLFHTNRILRLSNLTPQQWPVQQDFSRLKLNFLGLSNLNKVVYKAHVIPCMGYGFGSSARRFYHKNRVRVPKRVPHQRLIQWVLSRLKLNFGGSFNLFEATYKNRVVFQIPRVPKFSRWSWPAKFRCALIVVSVLTMVCFCSFERIPYSERTHFVLRNKFTKKWGEGLFKKIEKKYEGKILPPTHPTSVKVASILREIVKALNSKLSLEQECSIHDLGCQKRVKKFGLKYGTEHLKGLNWEVKVVDSYGGSACYVPGGKIFIFTKFIHRYDSGFKKRLIPDIEIATFIGHEVGHGVAQHSSEHLVKCFWALLFLLLMPFTLIGANAKIVPMLLMWQSRRMEFEADYIGLMLLASAGYDPRAAPKFYEPLGVEPNDFEEMLLSTHPSGAKRAKALNKDRVMGKAVTIYQEVRVKSLHTTSTTTAATRKDEARNFFSWWPKNQSLV